MTSIQRVGFFRTPAGDQKRHSHPMQVTFCVTKLLVQYAVVRLLAGFMFCKIEHYFKRFHNSMPTHACIMVLCKTRCLRREFAFRPEASQDVSSFEPV